MQDAEQGAGVAEVSPGSGAEDVGVRTGDVITTVGDRRVDGADSLIAAIRSYRPGDKVTITVLRGGDESTLRVTLGSDAG